MIDSNTVPVPNDTFCVREVGEETIILSEDGSDLHCLDEMATFIWKNINGKNSLGIILERIFDDYEVSKEVVEKDLVHFINALVEKGIISIDKG